MRIDPIKMEKLSQKALERKSNKPIMEKKRRARINQCLNQLKSLILETDNERSRHSKLEKADILEMTVKYLQTLRAYHVHLQQLHQLQTTTNSHQQQLQNFQLAQHLQQPISPLSRQSANTNLAHQANNGASSAPLSPAMSPQQQQHQQLNLQMSPSLALPLQLNAHSLSPSQLHPQNLRLHHLHLSQRNPLGLAHTGQQISPTAWRPW